MGSEMEMVKKREELGTEIAGVRIRIRIPKDPYSY
jgi:hypothetical protein